MQCDDIQKVEAEDALPAGLTYGRQKLPISTHSRSALTTSAPLGAGGRIAFFLRSLRTDMYINATI